MSELRYNKPVLVGVDGSEAGARALCWAAAEARRRGVALHVVHAGDMTAPESPARQADGPEATAPYGRQLLADTIATLAEDYPEVQVVTTLRDEPPAQLLTELSADADLLVVGTRGRSRLTGFLLGSVSQRVAGHARCPVVLVGDQMREPAPSADVLAGVSATSAGRLALRMACDEAALRGVAVRAVRSMAEVEYTVAPYTNLDMDVEQWRAAQQSLLDECVGEATSAFPDVTIKAELVQAPAHVALVDAARDAALLVVGCRRPDANYLSRLGPLASWLLHESPVPILVVGQTLSQ